MAVVQYCDIPFVSPFKFYSETDTPGIHFDDDWAYQRILSWQTKVCYHQKWLKKLATKFQITSTIAPAALKAYNSNREVVDTFSFSSVVDLPDGAKVYECTVNFESAYDAGHTMIWLYLDCTQGLTSFKFISEPIEVFEQRDNLLIFQYWNTFNDHKAVFTEGYKPYFICEAGIMDFEPGREAQKYINELRDTVTLTATPYRSFKLHIGEARGVADWVIDLLNRIFCCDHVLISHREDLIGKQYETPEGAKWDIKREKEWPLIGASIDLVEAYNLQALQQSSGAVTPGLIMGYMIDNPFSGGSIPAIKVTEIKTVS